MSFAGVTRRLARDAPSRVCLLPTLLVAVLSACRSDPPPPRPADPRERVLALLAELESGGKLPTVSSGRVRVGFQRQPNGAAISADVPLKGDEYLGRGLYVLGAPHSVYCGEATGVALRTVVGDGILGPALTSAIPGAPAWCNFIPVAFVFTRPVRRVRIDHASPAEVVYEMTAFDRQGSPVAPLAEAAHGFEAGSMVFETREPIIAWVIFGYQSYVTAVTAIEFEPS